MLLTLDIGNTNIKSALFENERLNEFVVHVGTDKLFNYLSKSNFTKAAICSVNPPVEKAFINYISTKGIKPFQVSINDSFNFKINYETPETLGMDRVCSSAGALEIATRKKLLKENQYIVTVDFGTATTVNIVSPSREFIGGLIAPGILTMLKSLHEKTAQLPLPDLNNYKGLVGNSTHSSIISGVINSTTGMISQMISELCAESNGNIPIIFTTGGNAKYILPYLNYEDLFEEALVLKGLKFIYDLNNT